MQTSKKARKPFWKLNKKELAEATREFDLESAGGFEPLSEKQQQVWNRLLSQHESEKSTPAPVRLRSSADVALLRSRIKRTATALSSRIRNLSVDKPFDLLKDFKLERLGYNPLDVRLEMNLVEQINQSATLLVGCAAVEQLLRKHPTREGYVISGPASGGYDVWAKDAGVAAEVFAAVSPGNQKKLKRDLLAVLKDRAGFAPRHRYVFFVCRSSEGFPTKDPILEPFQDPQLGEVWRWREKSVTIVPLSEDAVFTRKGNNS